MPLWGAWVISGTVGTLVFGLGYVAVAATGNGLALLGYFLGVLFIGFVITMPLAAWKGRNVWQWAIIGWFFSYWSAVTLLLAKSTRFDCPYCREKVRFGATVCPHCQRAIQAA